MPRRKDVTESDSSGRVGDSRTLGGIDLVEEATRIIGELPGRLTDDDGLPGGLIVFPPKIRPIIVGDLHTNKENLELILSHDGNLADIESGKAACILLGDALHDDRTGYMKDMRSSVEILDYVLALIVRYPGKIYYIKGNHDTFDERLRKSGISQGVEFRKKLDAERGEEYTAAVGRFFEGLPVFIIGEGFAITHAGPPRGGVCREELINIKRYPEKLHQLIWTRVNEFHGNPSLKEYGETDLRLTLTILGLPEDTQFIVGHNPIWSDGNTIGVWLNVIGIRNHHILYSGYGSMAPYITFVAGEMQVRTTISKKPEVYYYG